MEHQAPNSLLTPTRLIDTLTCLIIRLIIQTIRQDPSGPVGSTCGCQKVARRLRAAISPRRR
jgi:hypothetical protein